MTGCHKPAGFISADVEDGQVDIKFFPQLIKAIKIGRKILIDRNDIEGFLEKNKQYAA